MNINVGNVVKLRSNAVVIATEYHTINGTEVLKFSDGFVRYPNGKLVGIKEANSFDAVEIFEGKK